MPIAGNYGNGHFLLSGFICQIPAKYAKFFSIPLCIPIFATIRKWTYSAGNMKRVRVILTLFAYVLMAGLQTFRNIIIFATWQVLVVTLLNRLSCLERRLIYPYP